MTTRLLAAPILIALAVILGEPSGATLNCQEPRLTGRVPESIRAAVDSILDSARVAGLPTEPLVDRALEGASKNAPADRILAAVQRLERELRTARDALGIESSEPEMVAGASAVRAGATPQDLSELRDRRSGQSLTVAAAVLADLVAVGVPADTAIATVLALAAGVEDVEYIAFRRNVERDIALGASPIEALAVRADALASEALGNNAPTQQNPRRPRKP